MIKTQHPSNNQVLGAPHNWDQQALPCGALAVTVSQVDGQTAMASFWRPTAAELQALNEGALVALLVFGHVHPPVAVEVQA